MHRWRGWVLGVALLGGVPPQAAAAADLLRCTGPDGKTVFTDDKSVCPHAEPYQPSGSVHGVVTTPAAPSEDAPKAPDAKSADAKAADAEHWRQLKSQKEEELRQLTSEETMLRGYVNFCNDGHTVFSRDAAGVKEKIPCSQLHARLSGLDARAAQLRNYLEVELPEECRKAGCLPGWIR